VDSPTHPAFRLLARLPLRLLHLIGAVLGLLIYGLSASYRAQLRRNLSLAFPDPTLTLRLEAAAQAGRAALETLQIFLQPHEQLLPLIREVQGWEAVEAAHAGGRGILFISPHLGSFEIFGPFFLGRVPVTALYRPHKSPALQSLIEAGRGRYATLAPADRRGVRILLAALKRRETVFLLPDQVPAQGEGQWQPFFGRPAYTMTLAARLTEMSQVQPFMVCGERLPGGAGFRLHFLAPDPPLEGSTEARTLAINRNVENLVRRCPSQYLWGYNRYKVPSGVEPPPQMPAPEAEAK